MFNDKKISESFLRHKNTLYRENENLLLSFIVSSLSNWKIRSTVHVRLKKQNSLMLYDKTISEN